jgi:hypothetical protein
MEGLKIVSKHLKDTCVFLHNLSLVDYVDYALGANNPSVWATPGPLNNPKEDKIRHIVCGLGSCSSLTLMILPEPIRHLPVQVHHHPCQEVPQVHEGSQTNVQLACQSHCSCNIFSTYISPSINTQPHYDAQIE